MAAVDLFVSGLMFVAAKLAKCGLLETVFSYFVSSWKLVCLLLSFLIILPRSTAFLPRVSFGFLLLLNNGAHKYFRGT
jgi:hypothetical protein